MFRAAPFLGLVALTLMVSSTRNAKALNIEDCEAFAREHRGFVATGIRADMERGPEWAKANLPANRVQQILRFLFIEEQLRFRCERIFAEAELIAMERRADEEARARALANIPPPPVQRPPFAKIPNTKRYVLIPPMPVRRFDPEPASP